MIPEHERKSGVFSMTIYDIAEIAGVSASTVSRVINNRPGVGASTRQKVLKLMDSYNYSPNAIARGLVNRSSKTIGILVADIRNIHHTEGAYYIERELIAQGYCCIILNTGNADEDKVNAIEILCRRRVEGVVMMGSIFQCEVVAEAIARCMSDIPVAIVNGWLDMPNVYGVLSDEMGGVVSCVEHLISRGHKKIAFVCDEPYNPSNTLKEKGYLACADRLDINLKEWSYHTENSLKGGADATLRVLADHPEVDAVIYAVDLLAVSGLQVLHEKNIPVPDQIAVVGINDSTYARICTPPLTSLDNKRMDASVMAARILVDHIAGKKTANRVMLLPDLVVRKSS